MTVSEDMRGKKIYVCKECGKPAAIGLALVVQEGGYTDIHPEENYTGELKCVHCETVGSLKLIPKEECPHHFMDVFIGRPENTPYRECEVCFGVQEGKITWLEERRET